MKHRSHRLAPLGLIALLVLGACGSSGDSSTPAPSTVTTGGAAGTTPPTGSAVQVDANEATVAELQAAFEAAGISNAAKWAQEVEEYRPYPTSDPTFAKLRSELAKYNPSAQVVDQIVAAFSL